MPERLGHGRATWEVREGNGGGGIHEVQSPVLSQLFQQQVGAGRAIK